jgi:hypothetical protein
VGHGVAKWVDGKEALEETQGSDGIPAAAVLRCAATSEVCVATSGALVPVLAKDLPACRTGFCHVVPFCAIKNRLCCLSVTAASYSQKTDLPGASGIAAA